MVLRSGFCGKITDAVYFSVSGDSLGEEKVDLKHFITIPVMYFVGILPAWIAGRPFKELIGIYAFQGGKDRWSLSIKFPNIYQIIGNNFFLDEYVKAGMLLILGILMMVMFYLAYQKVQVTREYVILMVIFFGMLTTYFIPHMHERYLYVTDAIFTDPIRCYDRSVFHCLSRPPF